MILRFALALAVSLQASAAVTPLDLKADGKTDPLAALDAPRLSWRIESEQRGVHQTAWQILAASKPELLEEGKADLWDSGKIATERSPFVRYAGINPDYGKPCFWKVRVWTGDGEPSEWSEPAVWEFAPDWKGAKWIDDGKSNPEKDEDFYKPDPAPLLRKEFVLAKTVVRTRVHIAGLVAEHADSTASTVATGEGWKTGTGATLSNNLYLGDVRDARLAVPGWDKAGFDDAAWKSARVTEDTLEILQPIETPPVRLLEPIPAVGVTTPTTTATTTSSNTHSAHIRTMPPPSSAPSSNSTVASSPSPTRACARM